MYFELKNNYSHLKLFLIISIMVAMTLCILQFLGVFSKLDTLLLSFSSGESFTPLPTGVMVLFVMFHTLFPGILVLEEGVVKGLVYTVVTWLFYGVLVHSYTTSFAIYIPLVAPLLGSTISIIRVLGWEYSLLIKERNGIKKTFGSFVEPKVADVLLKNPDLVKQDGVRKSVTVMFTDLRGFSKLCEEIAPEHVITILRDCFGKLISIARANGGTIDKLIGDSLMVVWGNPVPVDNHQERAIEAAIEMQAVMGVLAKKWKQRLAVDLLLGIGINTDEVVVGTIGSEEFADYTVLGAGVNLAARLQAVCPGGKICVSKALKESVEHSYSFTRLGDITQKGTDSLAEVYELKI